MVFLTALCQVIGRLVPEWQRDAFLEDDPVRVCAGYRRNWSARGQVNGFAAVSPTLLR